MSQQASQFGDRSQGLSEASLFFLERERGRVCISNPLEKEAKERESDTRRFVVDRMSE